MYQQLLDEFFAYWRERVTKGEVSAFNRYEWLSIRIFVNWLEQRALEQRVTENLNATS